MKLSVFISLLLIVISVSARESLPPQCLQILNSSHVAEEQDGDLKGHFRYKFEKNSRLDGENPYLHPFNMSQRDFLENYGAVIKEKAVEIPSIDRFATQVNEDIDSLIEEGVVDKDEAIYWADTYVVEGELVFVRYGDEAPEGGRLFLGQNFEKDFDEELTGRGVYKKREDFYLGEDAIYGSEYFLNYADFRTALAQGFLPVMRTHHDFAIDLQHKGLEAKYESAFLHDLSHLGGLLENPKMMGFLRRVSQGIARLSYNQRENYDNSFGEVNENVILLSEESPTVFPTEKEISYESHDRVWRSIERWSFEELQSLGQRILELYPIYRQPLGGLVRTGTFSMYSPHLLDSKYYMLQQKLNNPMYAETHMHDFIRDYIADFLWGYHLLKDVTLKDYESGLGFGSPIISEETEKLREFYNFSYSK